MVLMFPDLSIKFRLISNVAGILYICSENIGENNNDIGFGNVIESVLISHTHTLKTSLF